MSEGEKKDRQVLLSCGCCSPLSPDQEHAIQRTEPAAVPQPRGAAEPGRAAEPYGPVSPFPRQTHLTDQEERRNRRLQGNQSGVGTGHQWKCP